MNLKYNLINPIICVIVSMYFISDKNINTDLYLNYSKQEKDIINEFFSSPIQNDIDINIYDIQYKYNKEYNYIIDNLNTKKDELDFLNSIEESKCKYYIQGGATRDALLNDTIRDIDVRSNCPINIIVKYLPKICKYKIIHDVIRIFNPVDIDISQLNDLTCHDFTINSIYFDYKKNILFETNNSITHILKKKLIFGCTIDNIEVWDPRYNLPFRFIKFKLKNFSYTKNMEEIMFDRFYYLYTNNKNAYNSKLFYYIKEWYKNIEDQQKFLNELKIWEDKVNDMLTN